MIRVRCPCNKCLVQPTCTVSCDKFAEMAGWFYFVESNAEVFFDFIDNCLPSRSKIEAVYTAVGENIIGPAFVLMMCLITGVSFDPNENILFGDRYQHWIEKKGRDKQ